MDNFNFSGLVPPLSPAASIHDFPIRSNIVLTTAYRASKHLENFAEDGDGFLTVALSKLEMHRQNVARTGPGVDPNTKFDSPQRLDNVTLVNEALRSAKTGRHVGTDLTLLETIALVGVSALLKLWVVVGLIIILLLIGAGIGLGILGLAIMLLVAGMAAAACYSKGDYDMTMQLVIPVIYQYGNLLQPDVYDHVLDDLLAAHTKGGASQVHEVVHMCGIKLVLGAIGETENHILMTEGARYLTNQLLFKRQPDPRFDNAQNGLEDWMLRHLQKFLKNDFWEFNSRPYQRLSVMALENLYDFAESPKVRKGALILLDYLSAKYAISSSAARRAAPFRRLKERLGETQLFAAGSDEEAWRFLMLAGDTSVLRLSDLTTQDFKRRGASGVVIANAAATMMRAAIGRYRVPEHILTLILYSGSDGFLHRFFHGTWDHGYGEPSAEVYYKSRTYLITGGGMAAKGRANEDSIPMPTTLMPAQGGNDWRDFIRIEGADGFNNLGVAPGFACGLNVVIPDKVKEGKVGKCFVHDDGDPWSFVNFADSVCDADTGKGFYATVYQENTLLPFAFLYGKQNTFGFFAVIEVNPNDYSFQQFIADVRALNGSTKYTPDGIHTFRFPLNRGPDIEFTTMPTRVSSSGTKTYDKTTSGIISIGGRPQETDILKWFLVDSQIFTTNVVPTQDWVIKSWNHNGCVMIDNIDTLSPLKRLILDLSDAKEPRRALVGRHDTRGCDCPLKPICDSDLI